MRPWLLAPAVLAPASAALLLGGCIGECPAILIHAVSIDARDERGVQLPVEVECSLNGGPLESWGSGGCGTEAGHYAVRVTHGDQVVERELDVAWAPGGTEGCRFPDTRVITIVFLDRSAP